MAQRILSLIGSDLLDAALAICQREERTPLASYLLSTVYLRLGKPHSALRAISGFLQSSCYCCILRGRILISLNLFEDAIACLLHCPQEESDAQLNALIEFPFKPQSVVAMLLCKSYLSIGASEKAQSYAARSLSCDGSNLEMQQFARRNFLTVPTYESDLERFHSLGWYSRSLEICDSLPLDDILCNSGLLFVYIDNLYQGKRAARLYRIASQLHRECQGSIASLVAIGTFHLLRSEDFPQSDRSTESIESARKYFCMGTVVDRTCIWAWLGFARTFSLSHEHDQAVAALSTVSKLAPRWFFPFLLIGLEHSKSDRMDMADRYIAGALKEFPANDFVAAEVGALRFHQQRYQEAADIYASLVDSDHFDPNAKSKILLNLGYALLAMEKFAEAFECMQSACQLVPSRDALFRRAIASAFLRERSFPLYDQLLPLVDQDEAISEYLEIALEIDSKA